MERVLHVSKAADVRHFLQGLLGEVQVVVWLDGQALPPLLTLQQPVKANHVALLLHMSPKLVVLVGSKEVSHVLRPVLIHLGSIPQVTQPYTATLKHLTVSTWLFIVVLTTGVDSCINYSDNCRLYNSVCCSVRYSGYCIQYDSSYYIDDYPP